MLYTIVPQDQIFYEDEPSIGSREVNVGGAIMQVQTMEDGFGKITRVISTNPQDYLNPQFQPGTTISLSE